jgi:histone acetyltransferase (RNA polymerase elongator complex component)
MTGMKPVDVTHENDQIVYKRLYDSTKRKREINIRKTKTKFNVGDSVRISKERGVFDKGYTANFSDEIFVVSEVLRRDQIVYKLKDLRGEAVTSIFYGPELVRVRAGKNDGVQKNKRRRKR